jgi:hypothetical protein
MFKSIAEFIKKIFTVKSEFSRLEEAIAASNPLTAADVEKVEREFWDKNSRPSIFDRYY